MTAKPKPKKAGVGRNEIVFTEAQVLAAVDKSRGIMSVVARALGTGWRQAEKNVNRYPKALERMTDEKEALIDTAESGLVMLMSDMDAKVRLNACQFVLERIGKRRGYSQRQEIDHTTNGKEMTGLTVRFVGADEP